MSQPNITADQLDVGTGANQVVQLDGSGRLPAVDGSQLTNLPSGVSTYLSPVLAFGGPATNTVWTHGIGAIPSIVQVYLQNVIAEGGYAPGEIVSLAHIASESDSGGGPVYDGIGVKVDSSFVTVYVSPRNVPMIGPAGGFAPTAANWDMLIRAVA